MQIINVIQRINGIISQIQSFVITGGNEDEKQIVVELAERCFIDIIKEHLPDIDKEDEAYYIEDGCYDDQNGHELNIIWSHSITEQTTNQDNE